MRVPYSWLCELLPGLDAHLEGSPARLEPVLARLGVPVEDILDVSAPPPGVLYGIVRHAEAIPGTELKRLEVDLGRPTGSLATVVTGAPNARAGIGVALAAPGTRLPALEGMDTDGLGLEVGVRTIQGVESWGMACSPRELGIGEYGGGLLELPAGDAEPGTPLTAVWPADTVLDLEITPNRADALSVLGVARDLAAALNLELREPPRGLPSEPDAAFPVRVDVLEPASCDRFVARAARGVRVAPSPAWLQRRLSLAGMRPINNLVDASNYVMLELGQPTAAYDWRDLPENLIVVRSARDDERVTTLDDAERRLDARDLVITTPAAGDANETRVIGVAGVIGARYAAITADTTDVVLEAAHFDPVRLRLTARRLGAATDAVYRFERGVDPNLPAWAADRYMQLVQDTAGGEVLPGRHDAGTDRERARVTFRPAYANELLGTSYAAQAMSDALERLGCRIDSAGDAWTVRPPTWRVDLDIEEELIEEVARLLGYDAIPETLPALAVAEDNVGVDKGLRVKRHLKDVIAGLGFQEIVSYSFTSAAETERARAGAPRALLRNPQSSERTALRTALYPSLLAAARVNRARPALLLFEIGRVFPAPDAEEERVGLLMSGAYAPQTWVPGVPGGFYAFKGLLEAIAARLGDRLEVRPLRDAPPHLHPGIAGEVWWNGYSVGEIGALHPQVIDALELDHATFVAELQLPLPTRPWSFLDVSRQPVALRDLAVIAAKTVPYADVARVARDAAGPLLENVEPFDVYDGPPVPAGSRSIALHLAFRAPGRTLTDAEVDAVMNDVINAVRAAGHDIRD